MSKRLMLILAGVVVIAGGFVAWKLLSKPALPPGFAGGNGRLEAKQIYVSTKYPGRIAEVLFNEGDTVQPGQVVARMDTTALEAQLRAKEAEIAQAEEARKVALTQVDVKKADYDYSSIQSQRSKGLVTRGSVSEQEAEIDNAKMLTSRAELAGAQAQVVQAGANIDAARAEADRLRAEI